MPMALIGSGPMSVGGANEFHLLRGLKSGARSTIPIIFMLWSHVFMAMALSSMLSWKSLIPF